MPRTTEQQILPGTEKALAATKPGLAVDRVGDQYDALLETQKKQLELYAHVLQPAVHAKLKKWAERTNAISRGEPWPHGRHSVPRGCELWNWLEKHAEFLAELEKEKA